jgi:hypothetical protein
MQNITHRNLIGRNVTAPTPVIAQQYFSTTFVSVRFHVKLVGVGVFRVLDRVELGSVCCFVFCVCFC